MSKTLNRETIQHRTDMTIPLATSSDSDRATGSLKRKVKKRRPSTSHLKRVPQEREIREKIREEARSALVDVDRSRPFEKKMLQMTSEALLRRIGLDPVAYLGFAMVTVNNEFWRDQLAAVEFNRRLLLLPHCLKHAEGCPADYDEFGLDCRKCGACSIADFKVNAEELGYKVLVAEGSPIVLKIIVSGYVDAIVGIACLNVLEKALDKILQVGVPSLAIPLLSSDCKNTSVDEDWVSEIIGLKIDPPKIQTRSFVPLLRAANELFDQEPLERLASRPRKSSSNPISKSILATDPVEGTEAIAYDYLMRGGKRFRPFITLASYDAVMGGEGTSATAKEKGVMISDQVKRVAISIEVFHKASVIHDDIEDDDVYRYGTETLHRKHGLPVALNVGDYLIGLGYKLVGAETKHLGSECAAEILLDLSNSHIMLSEGQGAELLWRKSIDPNFSPLDALKIYALKTAPAFEVALLAGLRLAGPVDAYRKTVVSFSRNLGVAFQILNDLNDWDGDNDNKLKAGSDIFSARPTLLLALALDAASPKDKTILLELINLSEKSENMFQEVQQIFSRYQVFEKAEKMIEKYRDRAEAIADEVKPEPLRSLLYFLLDTLLQRDPPEPNSAFVSLP